MMPHARRLVPTIDEPSAASFSEGIMTPSDLANGRLASPARLSVAVIAACPFPARRGTPVRIQRLAEKLTQRGHRVVVVTYHHGTGEADPSVEVRRIFPIRGYNKLGPGPSYRKLLLLDPLLAVKLARILRSERVDVIHAHHFEGLVVGAVARLGRAIPMVFDVHTLLTSELPHYPLPLMPGALKRLVASAGDRRLPRWADHVAVVTERIRAKLLEMKAVPEDRVSLVPNGVETDLFAVPGLNGGMVRQTQPTLIFTGNLAPYQGIDLMLSAFRRVLEQRKDARLQIVTESSFEHYEPLARELGINDAIDVVQAPFAEIPRLLAGADVAVNPRIDCDGIPVKLLNYMAASKPVVSFVGSAPGLAHQETGWLVSDGDVDGFARGALTLLDDREMAGRLGRNARQFVEAEHSWARSAELCEEIYYRLLARRR
jgi:glycosyltransferase involved in cell wall biosynthesis